jgi:hypothetical protein
MKLDDNTKDYICHHLEQFCDIKGSQNNAAKDLGVSGATISMILTGQDDNVADTMWRKIAKGLGLRLEDSWVHVPTATTEKILAFVEDARVFGNAFLLCGSPGSGKTHTLNWLIKNTPHVFYVKCQHDMPLLEVLRKILLTMGRNVSSRSRHTYIELIKTQATKYKHPIIIIDEMERLDNKSFLCYNDLYDVLFKVCGLMVFGTEYLSDRITEGVGKGKKGFGEMLSRIGGSIYMLPHPERKEVEAVIMAQGVTDPMIVSDIYNNSHNLQEKIDMRIVERKVHAQKQKQAAQAL